VLAGSPATFSAGAIGALPLAYQWYFGTNSIPGATSASYTIASASDINAGVYTVKVSNSLSGTWIASVGASLTVDHMVGLTNGLLVHLPFDGNYNDVSGNGNDGSPGGSPTFVPGKIGLAVHLDTAPTNIYNYVSIPTSTSFSYASNFSVSFWQRHTGRINDLPMAGNAVNSTYNAGWVMTADEGPDYSQARLETTLSGGGFIGIDPGPGPVINDGQWHHCAMVINRDAAYVALFVDGAEVYAQPLEYEGNSLLGDLTTGNALTIGSDPTGTYGVPGQYDIDDFALWSRPLAPAEVQAIYTLGQAGEPIENGYLPETVGVQLIAHGFQLNWASGTLQSAPTVLGPWTAVEGAAAPSYQVVPTPGTNQFYRVQLSGSGTLP
jgi:hypothetical protein